MGRVMLGMSCKWGVVLVVLCSFGVVIPLHWSVDAAQTVVS